MKFFSSILIIFLLVAPNVFAGNRGVKVLLPPVVIQKVGDAVEVNLIPVKFPIFKNFSRYSGGEASCVTQCNNRSSTFIKVSEQTKLFGQSARGYQSMLTARIDFDQIGRAYKKDTKIFVTWTVRLVGEATFIPLWRSNRDPLKGLCKVIANTGWHGYVYQEFTGGEARTRLMVNGTQRGNEAIMSIPFKGGSGVYTPSDPTITGSALLKAEDFGGEFPNVLNLDVQWENNTSLTLTSPLDAEGNTTRNLIITIMPVG